jgi:hypothetical protein
VLLIPLVISEVIFSKQSPVNLKKKPIFKHTQKHKQNVYSYRTEYKDS